jgi:glutamate synthase (NADPH/NADH) large chain
VIIGALLGADEFGFSTAPLIAAGCIMMRKCHLNTCPVGIATQDPVLRKRFKGTPEHVINYFFFVAEEVRELMAEHGLRQVRRDHRPAPTARQGSGHRPLEGAGLDFTKPLPQAGRAEKERDPLDELQNHPIDDVLDRKLIERPAGARQQDSRCRSTCRSQRRPVGRRDAVGRSRQALRPQGPARRHHRHVKLTGTAGQSFGAFVANGVTIDLVGDGNDYVGKGLCGGRLIVRPPRNSPRSCPKDSIIVGNTVLYGAIPASAISRAWPANASPCATPALWPSSKAAATMAANT